MTTVIGLCAAALLLTSVLTVWRRSQRGVVRVIAVQGGALAVLVAVIGADRHDAATVAVCLTVLGLKGIVLPWLLARRLRRLGSTPESDAALLNPTSTLVIAAALTVLAAALVAPLVAGSHEVAIGLTPVGIAMVLIGLLAMTTRRLAVAQLVGFLLIDNGIAAVAFFSSGGVPLLVELASSFDVLLVVVILQVFTVHLHKHFGDTDVHRLTELHD